MDGELIHRGRLIPSSGIVTPARQLRDCALGGRLAHGVSRRGPQRWTAEIPRRRARLLAHNECCAKMLSSSKAAKIGPGLLFFLRLFLLPAA